MNKDSDLYCGFVVHMPYKISAYCHLTSEIRSKIFGRYMTTL